MRRAALTRARRAVPLQGLELGVRSVAEALRSLFGEAQYRRLGSFGFARDHANLCGDMARVTVDLKRVLRRAEEEA
jgi:hypothetical protein